MGWDVSWNSILRVPRTSISPTSEVAKWNQAPSSTFLSTKIQYWQDHISTVIFGWWDEILRQLICSFQVDHHVFEGFCIWQVVFLDFVHRLSDSNYPNWLLQEMKALSESSCGLMLVMVVSPQKAHRNRQQKWWFPSWESTFAGGPHFQVQNGGFRSNPIGTNTSHVWISIIYHFW